MLPERRRWNGLQKDEMCVSNSIGATSHYLVRDKHLIAHPKDFETRARTRLGDQDSRFHAQVESEMAKPQSTVARPWWSISSFRRCVALDAPVSTRAPTRVGPFRDPTTRRVWEIGHTEPSSRSWSIRPAVRGFGRGRVGAPKSPGMRSLFCGS